MKNILFSIVLLISLFLVSCTPGKEISFDVLQAAEFDIPENIDSVLVLNLAYYPWVDTLDFNVIRKVKRSYQNILDTAIIASIFNGFYSVISDSYLPELTENQYYEIRGASNENFLDTLNIESVDYLCDEFNSSLIVALEYYGIDFNYISFMPDDLYYRGAELRLERLLTWRIYQKGVGLLYEENKIDTLYWHTVGVNYQDAKSKLPKIYDAISDAFLLGGESFANNISPYWKQVSRAYYSFTSVENKDVSMDVKFLNSIIEDKSGWNAYKAYYNLAVLSERNGALKNAIDYLESAEKLKPLMEVTDLYRRILKESYKNQMELEDQLNKRK